MFEDDVGPLDPVEGRKHMFDVSFALGKLSPRFHPPIFRSLACTKVPPPQYLGVIKHKMRLSFFA